MIKLKLLILIYLKTLIFIDIYSVGSLSEQSTFFSIDDPLSFFIIIFSVCTCTCTCTVDCEIFAVKNILSTTFSNKNLTRKIFCVAFVDLYLFWSLKSGDEICKNFASEIFYWRKYPNLQPFIPHGQGKIISSIITLRTCARGKAIGLYVCCCCRRRHKNRQISSSRRLCVL